MNSLFKRLSSIAIIAYILLVLLVTYFAVTLEDNLLATEVINNRTLDLIKPVINQFIWIIGLLMAFGMLSIIFLLAAERYKSVQENIIVESFDGSRKSEKSENSDDEDEKRGFKGLRKAATAIIEEGLSNPVKDTEKLLSTICTKIEASQAALFLAKESEDGVHYIELLSSYAYILPESETVTYEFGEGISGQAAKEGKRVNIKNVPDGYIKVLSGLGSSSPNSLAVFPFFHEKTMVGVVEIASFLEFSEQQMDLLADIFNTLGSKLAPKVAENEA